MVAVFLAVVTVFVLVELVSIVIGVRLTRTITGAVHNLYQGTERIRVGDFSHRIEVRGNDQLAELSQSFNHMTEDLERLVEVAKEKERLQSEIEIAREVQNQLFPKSVPVSKTLELAAACLPARLVSGDYYDYMNLEAPSLALAIGDVAGKGISAALLMATVQSTMRTQLRAGRELVLSPRAMAAAAFRIPPPRSSRASTSSSTPTRRRRSSPPSTSRSTTTTPACSLTRTPDTCRPSWSARARPPAWMSPAPWSGAFSFAEYGESSIRIWCPATCWSASPTASPSPRTNSARCSARIAWPTSLSSTPPATRASS